MQVDDRIVDEGEDPQLELGLAGVAILDHTGVGVGDWAAEGGREGGNMTPSVSCSPGCCSGMALVNLCPSQVPYSLLEVSGAADPSGPKPRPHQHLPGNYKGFKVGNRARPGDADSTCY